VERGPLVYALKLAEQWGKETNKEEGDYFTVHTTDPWNYGLLDSVIKNPAAMQVVKLKPVNDTFIWNAANAPIEIKTRGRKIPAWQIVNDVAPQPVTARDGLFMGKVADEKETITLIPYGCSKVRIVAFPVVRSSK
jgi:hypothetical protein